MIKMITSKIRNKPAVSVDTIIGKAIHLENVTIKGIGNIRVDGQITGHIELEGHLIINSEGKMEGDLKSAGATIAGCFEGEMAVTGTLHICSKAQVTGSIDAGMLVVDEGASVSADCLANADGRASRVIICANNKVSDEFKRRTC